MMTNAPRVQLVTRRFWPLSGDVPWRWLALATAMRTNGWQVEVVTALWHSSWPEHVELREFPVQRVYLSPTTPFRMRRAMRALVDWSIDQHQRAKEQSRPIDFMLVDAGEDEASALLDHAKELPPIVVRYESLDSIGPLSARQRQRSLSNCQRSHCVLVASEHARRELIAAGIPPNKVQLIYDAPLQRLARDPQSISAARRALVDINHELFLRSDDRLCVCLADMHKASGVEFVTRTIAPILEQQRGLRFWLIGDGPERLRLYDMLKREGWRRDVLMPGSFEDPDIVLSAADLCIVPGASQGGNWVMPTALASGLTTFVCDGPALRSRLGAGASELSYAAGDFERLRELLSRWCHHASNFQSQVRQVGEQLWSNNASVAEYMRLV